MTIRARQIGSGSVQKNSLLVVFGDHRQDCLRNKHSVLVIDRNYRKKEYPIREMTITLR